MRTTRRRRAGIPSRSRSLDGNFTGLRDYIRSLGVGGPVLLLTLIVMHAVIYYPSEIVTATAGFAYGWFGGLALAMTGWLTSALASYALGRWLGGPLLRSLLGARYRRFEHAARAPTTICSSAPA